MRFQVAVPGYLDEDIKLDFHDGAITIFQIHELMGDSTDSVYLEPDQVPALINALFDMHMAWKLNCEPHTHQPGNADGLIEPR